MQLKRNFSVIKLLLAGALFLTAAYFTTSQFGVKTNPPPNPAAVAGAKITQAFSYQGQSGHTALELLKQKYRVQTKKFDFGEMVIAINGLAADQKHFWGFYVNGQMAQTGAGNFATSSNDLIEWKLEEIH